jgi:hypothetical protein
VTAPKPHRPVVRDPAVLESLDEGSDPIEALHAAHESAAALLGAGRTANDPAVTERLVTLVGEIGLSTVADLWAARPARSLPGALWRLYVLREWVTADPERVAREYAAGLQVAEPDPSLADVESPGPDEVCRVADEILRGVFTGDFAVALERAAAFSLVVAAGRARVAPGRTAAPRAGLEQDARDLAACARLWRTGNLQ